MGEETYQIKVCVHDEVVAFAGAMNPKGELACEDEMSSRGLGDVYKRQIFVWSEAYKNDEAFIAHLANPAIGEYLQEHPKLADDFTVEVYGTVGDKCLEVMKGTGVPFKVFQSKLGYSRL